MNSYLYAPKDDEKHRAYWRVLYTLEEAAELTQLIKETTSRGIKFIYAISPGLDITFSNKQEVTLLEKKLQQVRSGEVDEGKEGWLYLCVCVWRERERKGDCMNTLIVVVKNTWAPIRMCPVSIMA